LDDIANAERGNMSAICGIFRFDGAPARRIDIDRQLNAMARRSPDGRKSWCDGSIGLGHGLLRVTGEDLLERQPLLDPVNGLALVADLRLDNREALADAAGIPGDELSELPDSAVLLAAYRKWGEDCVEHLLGDFAFAIWDGRARKLVLGRDHVGTRYVYFHRGPGFFAFASEKKGLWSVPDVPRRLNEIWLARVLVHDIGNFRDTPMFEGIDALLPGTVMSVAADGAISSHCYWEARPDPQHVGRDEAYYVEAYRRVLTEAVECRLRRNLRPTALFLSGGIDSSAIAALAAPAMAQQKRKLIAISSVLAEGRDGEPANARKWVQACERHMPHLDVRYVTREGFSFLESLDESFLASDLHSSPNRIGNAALFSAAAASGATLVMDGEGGDCTLNPRANGWLAMQLRRGRLLTFIREVVAHRRTYNMSLWRVLKSRVLAYLIPYSVFNGWRTLLWGSRTDLINPDFIREFRAKGVGTGSMDRFVSRARKEGPWRLLVGLLKNAPQSSYHILASCHGMDYAKPFHDKRVIELGLAIPQELQVRNGYNRHLARKALGDLLPPELLRRVGANDQRMPDFFELAERERPLMLEEIARMRSKPHLARYFNFQAMGELLARSRNGRIAEDPGTYRAIRSLLLARFVEWVDRGNYAEGEEIVAEEGAPDPVSPYLARSRNSAMKRSIHS
jgi:asparagine synthase (glutamine-hydrolysing)